MNLFPFSSLNGLARVLVTLLAPLVPAANRRITANLTAAFPEWSPGQIKKTARANLINTVRIFLEVYQAHKFINPAFQKKYITQVDEQTLDMVTSRKKGMVCIQGHFGNWEMPISWYAARDIEVPYSLKRQSNPLVNRWMEKTRKHYGGKMIYMEDSGELLKDLKKGALIGLVADQDAGPGGVFVPFFGRLASTFPGPALLSYLMECDLVVVTCIFEGRGRYRLQMEKITSVSRKEFPGREEGVLALTAKWSAALEERIRKHPEQYFWIHRRWKNRPPGDEIN